MPPSFQGTWVELGGGWLRIPTASRSPGLITYLIQAALQDDNQGEGNSMQAEEGIITVDRVHTIGVFEEKLLLLGGGVPVPFTMSEDPSLIIRPHHGRT